MTASLQAPGTLSALFDDLVEPFASATRRLGRRDEFLTIAGVRIRLSFAGDAMRERLLPALLSHPGEADASPDFTIHVWDGASANLAVPPLPWRTDELDGRGAIAEATRDAIRTAYMVGSSSLSMLDLDRGIGFLRSRDAEALPWYERAAPFRTLLHWMLESRGRRLVHAAAVGTTHGGALLAGRGGSGKSTTAMLCVEQGFDYAGDDYVGFSLGDVSRAHALYTSAKLSAASLQWLPFLAPSILVPPDGDEKGVAILAKLVPRQIADSIPLRAVIVPRVTGTSRLRRIGGGEALRALAPTTLLQLPGGGAVAFAEVAELVRRLPCWSLELGDDRAAIPALVAGAIEESR